MGEKGRYHLRCTRRGARASFLPGSGTRTRRKQVGTLATAAVVTRWSSRRKALLPVPEISYEEKNK